MRISASGHHASWFQKKGPEFIRAVKGFHIQAGTGVSLSSCLRYALRPIERVRVRTNSGMDGDTCRRPSRTGQKSYWTMKRTERGAWKDAGVR
ncbi:hypothetical protein LYSHEL_21860 [Lysobacter helvus]|uniref:Uncharacterized protein n=2 Tax=Lysobacteraceae TaxID=32033 RepID=A0ABN6G019_9GAMM|nr:hypothetical protein LYSCAS_21870 [Lysobacter caseinilyticus]BCT96315.1 hypothetical protein LYSHEL_21860 [Lysobacter helvus]